MNYSYHCTNCFVGLGVLLGYVYHYRRSVFSRLASHSRLLVLTIIPMLGFAYFYPRDKAPIMFTLGFTLIYLSYGGLVIVAAEYPLLFRSNYLARVLAWLGVYSYTIYLAQAVVFQLPLIGHLRSDNVWVECVLFWALSIAGGFVLSHLIERPFLRLRSRLFKPRTRAEAQPQLETRAMPAP